ncbi:hypothetical protein Tco_0340263 [Tanacetum coccineum]
MFSLLTSSSCREDHFCEEPSQHQKSGIHPLDFSTNHGKMRIYCWDVEKVEKFCRLRQALRPLEPRLAVSAMSLIWYLEE